MVRIINDIAEVHTLQENHGGWVDDMALVCRHMYANAATVVWSVYMHTAFMSHLFGGMKFTLIFKMIDSSPNPTHTKHTVDLYKYMVAY